MILICVLLEFILRIPPLHLMPFLNLLIQDIILLFELFIQILLVKLKLVAAVARVIFFFLVLIW